MGILASCPCWGTHASSEEDGPATTHCSDRGLHMGASEAPSECQPHATKPCPMPFGMHERTCSHSCSALCSSGSDVSVTGPDGAGSNAEAEILANAMGDLLHGTLGASLLPTNIWGASEPHRMLNLSELIEGPRDPVISKAMHEETRMNATMRPQSSPTGSCNHFLGPF